MSNTLGLDDDLDPVEAVISLEKAFALKISDGEASSCNTVGDIYDLLHSRFAAQIGEPGSCMTSCRQHPLKPNPANNAGPPITRSAQRVRCRWPWLTFDTERFNRASD